MESEAAVSSRNIAHDKEQIGNVTISDDVIGSISKLAVEEVEGVAFKSQKLDIEDGTVTVSITAAVDYGYMLPALTAELREKITGAIESMTGFRVAQVNIRYADIVFR